MEQVKLLQYVYYCIVGKFDITSCNILQYLHVYIFACVYMYNTHLEGRNFTMSSSDIWYLKYHLEYTCFKSDL